MAQMTEEQYNRLYSQLQSEIDSLFTTGPYRWKDIPLNDRWRFEDKVRNKPGYAPLLGTKNYNDYINEYSTQNNLPQTPQTVNQQPNVPATLDPSTGLPQDNAITPGATNLAPNEAFVYPDAFNDFVQAGIFGGNQAADLYGQGSIPKSFGGLSQQSFNMAEDVANSSLLGTAANTLTGLTNASNPYTSHVSSLNPNGALNYRMSAFSDPYAQRFSQLSTGYNPYGTQVARQARDNPLAASFNTLAGSVNPYGDQIGNGYQSGSFKFTAGANPYTKQVGGFQQSNPYQDQATNQGINPYTKQVASAGGSNPFMSDVTQTGTNPFTESFSALGGQANPYGNQIGNSFQKNTNSIDSNYSNAYQSQIGSGFQQNPYSFDTSYSNQYGNQIANSFQNNSIANNLNFDQSNPFLQGFQDFGNMQNSYLDATVDKALSKVTDRVNSQFGLAGRTGSGAHQQLMTESLGDVANQMYSDNFQQNANRSLQALQSGSSAYDSLQGRNLQSLGMGIDAFNTDQGRQLDYLSQAANLDDRSFANRLAATQAGADTFGKDQQRQLDYLSQAAGLDNQSFLNRLNATQTNADIFNTDQDRRLNTLINAGNFANQDFGNQLNAFGAASDAFNTDAARQLQGYGMGADIYAQDRARNLDALTQAGQFADSDAARQLQGIGMAGDMYSTDASRNLDALIQAGQMSAQDRDAALRAQGMTADQFNTDQNRQLDYLTQAANLFDTNRGFQADMYGNAADLFSDDRSRAIQALTQAGNFSNQDFGNNLAAASQGSSSWLANQGLNQDATRFNAGQFQNFFDNALTQNSQLSDMYQADVDNRYNAAMAMPQLQTANWQDANMLNSFGQQWDDTVFYNSNPWTNLQNYSNIIATLQGSVPAPEPGVSSVDRLMGLFPMLSLFK